MNLLKKGKEEKGERPIRASTWGRCHSREVNRSDGLWLAALLMTGQGGNSRVNGRFSSAPCRQFFPARRHELWEVSRKGKEECHCMTSCLGLNFLANEAG